MLVILDQNHHIIMSIWTLKRHCHESGLFRGKNHIDLDLLHGIACLTVLWHDKVGPTLRSDVFFSWKFMTLVSENILLFVL